MNRFEEASQRRRDGLLSDFWQFLSESKKWWVLPIVVVILLFAILVFLSGTAAAPFINTLF